jgi:hypothetical protein
MELPQRGRSPETGDGNFDRKLLANGRGWDGFFITLDMRVGSATLMMVEGLAKLPAESQSFMRFLLSKAWVHMRLRGGGIGVLNLANVAGCIVYPGAGATSGGSWLPESVSNPRYSVAPIQ